MEAEQQRPVPGQHYPDPLEPCLDKRDPGSYLCSFEFPLPSNLVNLDYDQIQNIRQVGTIDGSQTIQEVPKDGDPYIKKFPVSLEFVNRLNLPLFDWVKATLADWSVPSEGRPLVLAHAPNTVVMHRDNSMFTVLILPLRGVSFGRLWFADTDRQLVLKTSLQYGRAYLLNVSQFHGLWLPEGAEFWFVRHCFHTTTYSEVRAALQASPQVRGSLTYGC